jgi:hypothetical protein
MRATKVTPKAAAKTNPVLPPNTIEIIYRSTDPNRSTANRDWVHSVTRTRTYSTTEQFKEADARLQTSLATFMKETFLTKETDIIEIISIKCVGSNHEDTSKPSILPIDSQDGGIDHL